MKKIMVRLFLVLVVLLVLAAIAVHFFLDDAIKRGVETIGPKLAKVEIKLDAVHLSLLSGSGKVNGLVVGNPEGFKSPSAISVGMASLVLKPASLLSDKIVIQSINVQAPQITYETDLRANNLSKILANLEAASGGQEKEAAKPKETTPAKKLQVDDFIISGGKVRVSVTALGGQSATVSLPEIHLKDLGKDSDGITPADLSKKVLQVVLEAASKEAATVVTDLSKGAAYLTKDLGKTATNSVQKATKSLGDLFKKNK